jgi:hypothetical protein
MMMGNSKFLLAASLGLLSSAALAQSAPPGHAAAARAYAAFEQRNYEEAVRQARTAAQSAPANRDYQMLLVNSLVAARQRDEALLVADAITRKFGAQPELQLQRANLLLEGGRRSEARTILLEILNRSASGSSVARSARIALADAALADSDHGAAAEALNQLEEVSYDKYSRLGFAEAGLKRHELASRSFETAFHLATSEDDRALMARSQIDALTQSGQKAEAQALLAEVLRNGTLESAKPLEIAYLASAAGADSAARTNFARAEAEGALKGQALLDAAYNAKRVDQSEAALRYFGLALEENRAGTLAMEPQSRLYVTQEVASLNKRFSGYLSIARSPAAAFASATPGATDATYAGGEIYWRPLEYDTSFELFARAYATVAADEGVTGFETLQGYAGARWRPLLGYDLVFEGSYLFPVGGAAREDWLLRAAYSLGRGGDIRLDRQSWNNWSIYGELGYFINSDQTIGNVEARYGRSFRLGDVSTYTMITPFVGARLSYDTDLRRAAAFGIGPGISLRKGIGATPWRAPSSVLDLVMQYRFRIAGGEQAEGIAAGATLSF